MTSEASVIRHNADIMRIPIPLGAGQHLSARVVIPDGATSLIILARCRASSREGEGNRYIAEVLNEKGFATLVTELWTTEEQTCIQQAREPVLDIPLLAKRFAAVVAWKSTHPQLQQLECGYFGSSMGAPPVLIAAADEGCKVRAVVVRCGRADFTGEYLAGVRVPTLMVAGSQDREVLRLNKQALSRVSRMEWLTPVSHRLEEAGALDMVAQLTAEWFSTHLCQQSGRPLQQRYAKATRTAPSSAAYSQVDNNTSHLFHQSSR